MNILLDNGCHHMKNMGDVAMLQVAVRRFRELWPDACIQVLTGNPVLLKKYCPEAAPIPSEGYQDWFRYRNLLGRVHRYLPKTVSRGIASLESHIRCSYPLVARRIIRSRMKLHGTDERPMKDFLHALLGADIVVVSGGGDFTDAFESSAVKLLDILDTAGRNGKITAMLGQGLGPIQNPRSRLTEAGKRVFPRLDFIGIRENRVGPSLLHSFCVDPSRFTVTGDDAVELAYDGQNDYFGTSIGVNLRASTYAEIGSDLVMILRDCLREASKKYHATLFPVPISLLEHESDITTALKLINGLAAHDEKWAELDTPQGIIGNVKNARVVVTGSYHAAVFALAQGIPAVCLARSEYYANKFLGLADQFQHGCHIVRADDGGLHEKVRSAVDTAWTSAEQVRPHLLRAAMRQIESGRAAYRKLFDIFSERRQRAGSNIRGRNGEENDAIKCDHSLLQRR